jgi:hypothetical protein
MFEIILVYMYMGSTCSPLSFSKKKAFSGNYYTNLYPFLFKASINTSSSAKLFFILSLIWIRLNATNPLIQFLPWMIGGVNVRKSLKSW